MIIELTQQELNQIIMDKYNVPKGDYTIHYRCKDLGDDAKHTFDISKQEIN